MISQYPSSGQSDILPPGSAGKGSESYELTRYLPPYRSLLSPDRTFDYRSHKYVDGSVEFKLTHLFGRKRKPDSTIKMNYRSLLSPLTHTKKRILDAASDTLSVKSFKSTRSMSSLRRVQALTAQNLMDLPDEILTLIFKNLADDHKSLVYLLYVNKRCNYSVKPVLYENPYITSTYRLAQLVHTITNNQELALMVKTIDLSKINPGLEIEENALQFYEMFITGEGSQNDWDSADKDVLAGWRDWRYRDHPLYGLQRTVSGQASRHARHSSRPELVTRKVSTSSNSTTMSLYSNHYDSETELSHTLSTSPIRKTKKVTLVSSIKRVFKQGSGDGRVSADEISDWYSDIKTTKQHPVTFPAKISDVDYLMSPRTSPFDGHSQPYSTSHPLQNRFLSQYCFSKDVPIGYLLHILQECKNLVHIDFSGVSCSNDFEMKDYEYFNWQTSKGKLKRPPVIACRSLLLDVKEHERKQKEESLLLSQFKSEKPIFWSDTQRELDWQNTQHVQLEYVDIFKQMNKLENLQTIKLRSICWLTQSTIRTILAESRSRSRLQYIDCTDSGMRKSLDWAKKRSVKQWERYLRPRSPPRRTVVQTSSTPNFENIGQEYY
ncbi:hypothetical protein OGAPHI_006054 [Ogataea philodendri]|uniref:F-box domain-containing protein n=1 Tax=Ogataea philodendri TaxID=1378263 RepID=A0A9P8NY26_9ASCO|nr:uncharacterized protein OGAPHI_006054 [Ogataea philodendri]KAH3661875.1 hypothetical protein OGAPHI_006054 [Ogataea philodendri]